MFRRSCDAETCNVLDLGSDHRTLLCRFGQQPAHFKRRRPGKPERPQAVKTWPPDDIDVYVEHLAESLGALGGGSLTHKCENIQEAISSAMREANPNQVGHGSPSPDPLRAKIQMLMAARRDLLNSDRSGRAELSKDIRKAIKSERSQRCSAQIATILHKFSNFKAISGIKSRRKNLHIAQMEDSKGNVVTNAQEIADVFADVYADLYNSTHDIADPAADHVRTILPFSMEELIGALRRLKAGKSKDLNGVVAEMLKHGGASLKLALLELFNDAIHPDAVHPQDWKTTCIRVLLKSGNPCMAKNYRPISVLPMLYKLFSVLISTRIERILESRQCEDQAGFRKGYSTLDHIFSNTSCGLQL